MAQQDTSENGTLRVRVAKVVQETSEANSLVLEPLGGKPLDYQPGQFLTFRIPTEHGGPLARCYSLCSSPMLDEPPKVTVKRIDQGYASNWICDHVAEGSTFEILPPSGTFTPPALDVDFLLLAGGSGITPTMSILKSCLHAGSGSVVLVYANRDENSVIFRDELAELVERFSGRLTVLHWLESVQGIPTASGLRSWVGAHTHREIYICGPTPFMDLAVATLTELGAPSEHVHVEVFTSLESDPFVPVEIDHSSADPASTIEVELDGTSQTLPWPSGNKLLDVLLAAGVDAPYSCREGACSACTCLLVDGEVEMEHNQVLDNRDIADGLILACQSLPVSDRVRITYDG